MVWPTAMPWRRVGIAFYVGLNLAMMLGVERPEVWVASDWALWQALPSALAEGRLYDTDTFLPYPYSPIAAPMMMSLTALGIWGSVILHLAALFLLRSAGLVALTLVTWGFWADALGGNVMVYAFVAGVLALRGHRMAKIAYVIMLVLVPRPVMVPLALWLLWKDSQLRVPAALIFLSHALAVLITGYAGAWIATMFAYGLAPPTNLGPVAFVGVSWFVVGIPLGVWLTWRGWTGLAGLAVSPYILPIYLLSILWDVVPKHRSSSDSDSQQSGRPVTVHRSSVVDVADAP